MRSLVVIDPQRDFCKPDGALYVGGADEDMKRLAAFVDRVPFDAVHVTLDSHQWIHIAHPIFWADADGKAPPPFTVIGVDDVTQGRWMARDPHRAEDALRYVRQLAERGRYQLTLWPPHCVLGTPGHAVHDEFGRALRSWSEARLRPIDFVLKGSSVLTEHYSAIQADVPDPNDPGTLANQRLIEALLRADELVFAGEALDYCLLNTLRDLTSLAPEIASKIVVLSDASSSIGGCSVQDDAFYRALMAKGARLSTTKDYD